MGGTAQQARSKDDRQLLVRQGQVPGHRRLQGRCVRVPIAARQVFRIVRIQLALDREGSGYRVLLRSGYVTGGAALRPSSVSTFQVPVTAGTLNII